MSNALFSNRWTVFLPKVKEKWGKLTDEEITKIDGRRDQLLKRLHEHYGWSMEKAEEELKKFEHTVETEHDQEAINRYYRDVYLKRTKKE